MLFSIEIPSPKTCNTLFIFLWEVILVIGRDTQPKLFQTKFELVHRETGRDRKCYAVIVFYVLTTDCKLTVLAIGFNMATHGPPPQILPSAPFRKVKRLALITKET